VIAILDRTLPSATNGAPSVWNCLAPAILYVDDDEMIREICGEILSRAGYSVDLARGGEDGWDLLQRKKYHLLIANHDMPEVTGLELVVRVRGAGMELPIIIASGFVSFTDDDTYAWLRFSFCLRKPFTPATLQRAVEDVLRADALLAQSSAS
jgi:DNA-binding response OmpR family regulator